ncbi:putative lipid II flippase FtsW [Coriobacterium glomerans]|uniref:putative lipid II flippase FtsW n=1 Tax=Coriobacterium glomerans TaxID=33871 RepID=UPI000306DEA1|nr:putative lipid II flippase FtsW [Coriobacterium glomerans]
MTETARRPKKSDPASGGSPSAGPASSEHSRLAERLIGGVPARIMRPRLIFLVCLAALLGFGLLMVYSASSVEALKEVGSSTYYLERQALFIAVGAAAMLAISRVPLEIMRRDVIWGVWAGLLLLLLAVLVLGHDAGGARRWVSIGFVQFQPSEFAKAIVIVTAAKLFHEYYEARALQTENFLILLAVCVCIPLLLIIVEPDFGTCAIIGTTIFAMCYLAGFSYRLLAPLTALAVIACAVIVLSSSYRSARLLADPWADALGDGYQATLAIMAFASGGPLGRGIGNSTMKYSYLPEAHNDYILAIIGEELGYVGTIIFLAVVALLIYAALTIAKRSPTIQGRMIATGCGALIAIQFLVNALGILGAIPMTGKTMPFISYGGSSVVASLVLCGLILRVSIESATKTVYDERREDFAVLDESTAGQVHVRSSRRSGAPFTVVDGSGSRTASDPPGRLRAASWRGHSSAPLPQRADERASGRARGRDRVEPAERLRRRAETSSHGYDGGRGATRSRPDTQRRPARRSRHDR